MNAGRIAIYVVSDMEDTRKRTKLLLTASEVLAQRRNEGTGIMNEPFDSVP